MNTFALRRAATTLTAAAAILVTSIVTSTPPSLAGASGTGDHIQQQVQQQVDAYRAAHPGGRQISATEVSYGGVFIVAVVRAVRPNAADGRDGPDCPGGWFCFYDGINYGYPRGRLSSCGWQDLAWWGWHDRTESVHYNLSSGTVWFINHGGTNHSGDTSLFYVDTGVRTRFDVAPYRNVADHVYRYC